MPICCIRMRHERLVDDNVILIGDAAGLAYPQSGEGIRPAVESALLAARVIMACKGDYSAARLGPYHDLIEQRFGKRRPEPALIECLPAGIKQWMAAELMKTNWFTQKIVTDRWFLQSHQQPLNTMVS